MCSHIVSCVFVLSLLVLASNAKNNTSNDVIGFPEAEENPDLKNKDDRQPVYLPSMCSDTELYYPGDQKDDWICDCRPAFLYHPPSDACWASFQRGPCADGQYLTLPQNSVIPTCENNPCKVNGYVLWNSKCERLGSVTPCSFMYPIPAALGVNATTLVVSCVRLTLESRWGEVRYPHECAAGSKRSVSGKCVPVS